MKFEQFWVGWVWKICPLSGSYPRLSKFKNMSIFSRLSDYDHVQNNHSSSVEVRSLWNLFLRCRKLSSYTFYRKGANSRLRCLQLSSTVHELQMRKREGKRERGCLTRLILLLLVLVSLSDYSRTIYDCFYVTLRVYLSFSLTSLESLNSHNTILALLCRIFAHILSVNMFEP